jgi:hypothetical protein
MLLDKTYIKSYLQSSEIRKGEFANEDDIKKITPFVQELGQGILNAIFHDPKVREIVGEITAEGLDVNLAVEPNIMLSPRDPRAQIDLSFDTATSAQERDRAFLKSLRIANADLNNPPPK